MWRHYLSMAVRGIVRHRLYSLINIAGLSIGLAAAILILLYVRNQLSYDKWIADTRNLYRLEVTFHPPGRKPIRTPMCPFPVLTAAGEQIPQIKAVTHVHLERTTVMVAGRQFSQMATVVDPNFFSVIHLPLLKGDPSRVLAQPESVVLSESLARKYFGSEDPVGRILNVSLAWNASCRAGDERCLNAVYPLKVSGVLKDLPHNTQLRAALVIPDTSRADRFPPSWKRSNAQVTHGAFGYLELAAGASPQRALAALEPILDQVVNPKVWGIRETGSRYEHYRLTPFTAAHLTSDRYGGMRPGGSRAAVYGLAAIAVLILLVASFNFINLSTARASVRAREIAVRKLAGAKRRQLIAQLLGETVLMATVSLAVALSLVELLTPAYDRFLAAPVALGYLFDWRVLGVILLGTVAVGLASGLYPAFVLSAHRPAVALKPALSVRGAAGWLRETLVVAQFAVSIGLAIAVVVMLRQADYTGHLDLGFHHRDVVVVGGISKLSRSTRRSLAQALKADPHIRAVAYSDAVPFRLWDAWTPAIHLQGRQRQFMARLINISPQYPRLYGMRLLAGRLLSRSHGGDVSSRWVDRPVLINVETAHRFGLGIDGAVGRTIAIAGLPVSMRVVGVLADAKLGGLTRPVGPLVFYARSSQPLDMSWLSIAVNGGRMSDTLAYIDRSWHAVEPDAAIDRYLLSDAFSGLIRPAERQGDVLGLFAGVAILIACLGLFGLSVFSAERRTKEIGVRKICGGRTLDIVRLFLWRISLPVLAANAIAWPAAYLLLRRWLATYAYRVPLSPLYFLAVAAGALALAWVTVFVHTLRMARTSPVRALRYE